jgi:hypothetical protein
MTDRTAMTYDEAIDRVPDREVPDFWVGDVDTLRDHVESIDRGTVRRIATSPGGHGIDCVHYGGAEEPDRRANFNSAVAAGDPAYYAEKASREQPVVYLVGPVHGAETEGLTGLVNLIAVLETGRDLSGRSQPDLRALAERCRLLIVPLGNPDGLARIDVATLQGMDEADLRFWGQGTWSTDEFMGWPGAKQRHPMVGDEVGFLGGYFNDDGVNPMHDEFFAPMGPESEAILRVAREAAPDIAASLHSYESAPAILRPSFLPMDVQEEVRSIQERHDQNLRAADLPVGEPFEPAAETGRPPPYFNLVSALYHTSGATAFVHESPHGLADEDACTVSLEEILDAQLALYESIFRHALA